jgi:hypothetical protein
VTVGIRYAHTGEAVARGRELPLEGGSVEGFGTCHRCHMTGSDIPTHHFTMDIHTLF